MLERIPTERNWNFTVGVKQAMAQNLTINQT